MDLRKIKKLMELVENSQIDEIEIQEGDQSIRICRQRTPPISPQTPTVFELPPTHYTSTPLPSTAAKSQQSTLASAADQPPEELPGYTVTAPMVGIFYAAPSPTTRTFVECGQSVAIGDTLCIIEAMKIMNQIEAEISGIVRTIMIENGQPVEFEQPLMIIDPDKKT